MKKGFTLIELLVVIIIIGILASLALPNYLKTRQKSYSAEAWTNLGLLLKGAKAYYADHGAAWTSSIDLLPVEDPNDASGGKFTYTVTPDGTTVTLLAVPKAAQVSRVGTTEYRLVCSSCNLSAEQITRNYCTGGGTSCTSVGG